MRAGQLRHLITIQQATESRTSSGAVSASWATHSTNWAEINPTDGTEYFGAQGIRATVMHKIRMRYRSGITPKMRVSWNSRIFQIVAVETVEERGRETWLKAYEVVS